MQKLGVKSVRRQQSSKQTCGALIVLRLVATEHVGHSHVITPRRSAEVINSNRRHHRLASSRNTGAEQRLVRSIQPPLKLRSIQKPLSSAFLSSCDDIMLPCREVCR